MALISLLLRDQMTPPHQSTGMQTFIDANVEKVFVWLLSPSFYYYLFIHLFIYYCGCSVSPSPCNSLTHSLTNSLSCRPIEKANKGRKMLEKMGWHSGGGLGRDEDGIMEPVSIYILCTVFLMYVYEYSLSSS